MNETIISNATNQTAQVITTPSFDWWALVQSFSNFLIGIFKYLTHITLGPLEPYITNFQTGPVANSIRNFYLGNPSLYNVILAGIAAYFIILPAFQLWKERSLLSFGAIFGIAWKLLILIIFLRVIA